MDEELAAALEKGELTQAQLRRLIAYEAGLMGLDYETAVDRARHGTLEKTAVGMDIELLVTLLDES